VNGETPKIDLRTLGEPTRFITGAGVLDIVGRRDRTLLVVLTNLIPFQDREALRDVLSTLKVPCIMVPEEFVRDLTLLTRGELSQVRDAADAIIEGTAPRPLTPDKTKEAARRVYEGLKDRPELKDAIFQLLLEDTERDARNGSV